MHQLTAKPIESASAQETLNALNEIGFYLNQSNIEFILREDLVEAQTKRIISAQIITACESIAAIKHLCSPLCTFSANALPIARRVFESCLVASYICTDPERLAKRAEQYSMAHAHLNSTRFARVGETAIKVKSPYRVQPGPQLKEALDQFKKPGGGLRPCFEENREQQIIAISALDSRAGMCFSSVESGWYTSASEVTHGSLAAFDLARIEQQLLGEEGYLDSVVVTCFAMASLSVTGLSRTIHSRYPAAEMFFVLTQHIREAQKKVAPEAFSS